MTDPAPSAGTRPADRVRATRWILAAALAGLALRVFLTLRFPEFDSGDAFWYVRIGAAIRQEGLLGANLEKFDRPPLYPWLVSLFTGADGELARTPLRLLQCVLSASAIWFWGDAVRRLLPGRAWIGVAIAWVHAFDPWAADFAKILYSENLGNPVFAALIWTAVRAFPRPSAAEVAALGVLGAAECHVRFDMVAVFVPAMAALAFLARSRGVSGAVGRWACAAVLGVALCVPWSVFASSRRHEVMFVGSTTSTEGARANHGWFRFLSGVYLRREEWLGIYWWGTNLCPDEAVPSSIFDDADEERTVRDIMRRSREARTPVAEEQLAEIARDRAQRHPVRQFVMNPLRRSLSIWLDPTDSDRPTFIAHRSRSAAGRIFDALTFAYVLLGAVGFVASFVALLRPRTETAFAGFLVIVRTYGVLTAGLITGGQALFERRYMTQIEPLAQMLALWAAAETVDWIRRRRGGGAGTT